MVNKNRIGKTITCLTCKRTKKPVGRDAAAGGGYYCTQLYAEHDGCKDYGNEPYPDTLWPGERG